MSRLIPYALIILLGTLQNPCHAEPEEGIQALIGGRFSYSILSGDYLEKIGARFGVSAQVIARDNDIPNPNHILPGQNLWINNRHIVPEFIQNGIVINIPQRMLFLFQDGKLVSAHPVGLGKPTWPTVQGTFQVAILKKNPIWLVPKSIQEEMAREGRIVKNKVPPGPDNPLGEYWIGLDAAGYGIHGTIAPASVYHFQSHGCIRLHHDDIEQLFPRIGEGLIVKIIYVPVLMAEENGHVFIEINPDIYSKALPPLDVVHQLAEEKRVADRIDWQRVHELVLRQDGIALDVYPGTADLH